MHELVAFADALSTVENKAIINCLTVKGGF
jgi:hypothetical protein